MVLFFYLFSFFVLTSSIMVIFSKNPVYSVLWLIFAFLNVSGLMILIGAEFIAMMLVIIYVGAVAVLFLFVVMMLDIKYAEIKGNIKKNLSTSILLSFIMFADLVAIILVATKTIEIQKPGRTIEIALSDNSLEIGKVLYTDFILPFQISGLILFVAMISCIVLTFRSRSGVKRQDPNNQISRNKINGLEVLKVQTGKGIEGLKYD